jgi:hypothetical protein
MLADGVLVLIQPHRWKRPFAAPGRPRRSSPHLQASRLTPTRVLPLYRPIGDLVAELNPVLRGWGNYFRWGNSARKFSQIDDYVRERLALFDSKKRQKRGRRWGAVTPMPGRPSLASIASLGQSAISHPRQCAREHRRRAVQRPLRML